jgi:hypothetical protein
MVVESAESADAAESVESVVVVVVALVVVAPIEPSHAITPQASTNVASTAAATRRRIAAIRRVRVDMAAKLGAELQGRLNGR